jgi:hypothetical protein
VILPVALTIPLVIKFPPTILPVVLIVLDPVFIPAAVIVPTTLKFPPVILPVADIVEVVVIACASLITVVPLILIAIFALLDLNSAYFFN